MTNPLTIKVEGDSKLYNNKNLALRIRKKHHICPSYLTFEVGFANWNSVEVSRHDAKRILLEMRKESKRK